MMKIAPLPVTEAIFDRFTITLNGQEAPVSAARVSAINYNTTWPGRQRPLDQTEIAGFVRCESDGPVEVCVTVNDPVKEVCLRPLSKNVAIAQNGNVLTFTLPGPGQYVLEPNDFHRALHLFVAPEVVQPAAGPDDLYYGPGVHEIGIVELHDNQTVILDAGAVVYGGFVAFGAKNITFTGTGILDGSWEKRTTDTLLIPVLSAQDSMETPDLFLDNDKLRAFLKEFYVLNGCIRLYNCKNCIIEHITCRDASTFTIVPAACDNILIDDVKLIGNWRYNSDGVDYFNSSNCVLRNSFLRNFDDCVVLKGICGWGHRNLENIITENCVVWCDWGRGLEVGAETNADEYRNIIFRNCDLIHGDGVHMDIQHTNDAYIHDILFEDIRCEYNKKQRGVKYQHDMSLSYDEEPELLLAQPIAMGAFHYINKLYGLDHSGQNIERIYFKNIQIFADEEVSMPISKFEGLDQDNHIDGVIIENLTFNGKPVTNAQDANLHCNEFAWNITIK